MKVIKVNKKNKNSVDKIRSKDWLRYNKEKGYNFKEKEYSFAVSDNKKFIGYMKFIINSGAGYLDEIIVSKSIRGKGIGKILIKKFENILKKEKCHVAYLKTNEKNIEAIKFYKKGGYRKMCVLKDNISHLDWYYLEKRLK